MALLNKMHSYNIFTIILIILTLAAFIILIFLLVKITEENKQLKKEIADQSCLIEQRIRNRTRQLELIRDTVSEYAVQKFELAQELELRNKEISLQRDELLKKSEELSLANEEIKKLDNFKHRMIRMIIHDLKNPLNVLINIVDNMDVARKPGVMIKQIAWEMLDLTLNLLEINKFEESKMKPEYEEIDIGILLGKTAEKYSLLTSNSEIQLKISYPESCFVNTDRNIIGRVLDNLLGNALKYTSSGGCIEIAVYDYFDKVQIEITDNGRGIPKELLNNIFDEYVIGKDRNITSTGIGLSYCKLAIESLGENIGISSRPGVGTKVWFKINKVNKQNVLTKRVFKMDVRTNRLNQADIMLIKPVLEKIKETSIYEGSAILSLLEDSRFYENERLQNWKESLETALFTADNKLFSSLIHPL